MAVLQWLSHEIAFDVHFSFVQECMVTLKNVIVLLGFMRPLCHGESCLTTQLLSRESVQSI